MRSSAPRNGYGALLRRTCVWPTIGNHDTAQAMSWASIPYYNMFSLPSAGQAGGMASGTPDYYSFDYGNIHLICLDSMRASDRARTSAMAVWLRADLAATAAKWIIAYWHHPPYSKGSHDSDAEAELREMRENYLPILEAGGVDLVLGGHSHSYERSFLLNGHYGLSSTLTGAMKKDPGKRAVRRHGAYSKSPERIAVRSTWSQGALAGERRPAEPSGDDGLAEPAGLARGGRPMGSGWRCASCARMASWMTPSHSSRR